LSFEKQYSYYPCNKNPRKFLPRKVIFRGKKCTKTDSRYRFYKSLFRTKTV
jgi:hypothetical protein